MRIAILLALFALPAAASPCKVATPGLLQKARVTCEAARATALAKVKNASVKSAELEVEKGRLVYSFDLEVPGDKDVREVQVDARTGEVVSIELETPAKEAAEQ